MKNKQGGFGPNYTPWVGVTAGQFIASEEVSNAHQDGPHLVEAIEQAEANTGQTVKQAQADSNYATASNILHCEGRGIDPCLAPMNASLERETAAAKVPAWPEGVPTTATHVNGTTVEGTTLPRTQQGKLTKAGFTFDVASNCYTCPLGQTMPQESTHSRRSTEGSRKEYIFRCKHCDGCPFRPVCTTDPKGRTVRRTEDEPIHERQRERMKDEQHRADYRQRRCTVEPTFGVLKGVMGFRQFLLRGLEGVRTEWTLATTAFNVRKLVGMLLRNEALRERFRALLAARMAEKVETVA